jgi:hypothetical protein
MVCQALERDQILDPTGLPSRRGTRQFGVILGFVKAITILRHSVDSMDCENALAINQKVGSDETAIRQGDHRYKF